VKSKSKKRTLQDAALELEVAIQIAQNAKETVRKLSDLLMCHPCNILDRVREQKEELRTLRVSQGKRGAR
jgi:hypothetical protein